MPFTGFDAFLYPFQAIRRNKDIWMTVRSVHLNINEKLQGFIRDRYDTLFPALWLPFYSSFGRFLGRNINSLVLEINVFPCQVQYLIKAKTAAVSY